MWQDLQGLSALLGAAAVTLVGGCAWVLSERGQRERHLLQLQQLREQLQQVDQQRQQLALQQAQLGERLLLAQRSEEQLLECQMALDDARESLALRSAQLAELEARRAADQQASEDKIALLQQAREQLSQEFQLLASQVFEQNTRQFSERSHASLGALLTPLKEQLGEFKRRVDDVYDKETRDRQALFAQIHQLKQLNQQLSEDAINLTQALKGDSKAQGNWGEVILERVLAESGLRKGHEYQTQVSLTRDGQRYMPDAIVHLPDDKDIIVDSKVSLTAFERYCSSDDPALRERYLREHTQSLRNHVRGLSDKAYQRLEGVKTLDFVLQFVPVEGAFTLALEADPELFRFAFDRNIVLVSPATLLVTLRTVQHIWRYEQQSRNAQQIAQRGAELYDKFVGFIESMDDLGRHLERANTAFDTSYKRLTSGRGNLVHQANQLSELGVRGKKQLSAGQIADSQQQ